MKKIVIFGLGAVGATLSTCLVELFQKNGEEVAIYFVVRDQAKALEQLHRAEKVKAIAQFIIVSDFKELENKVEEIFGSIGTIDLCINASVPEFNNMIQKIALQLGSNYADMASDMYNEESVTSQSFMQQNYHQVFLNQNNFALINNGVSPGITNFLVGEKIQEIKASEDMPKVKSINLYLLEHIDSEQIVFSWSPQVALEELEDDPKYFKNGELETISPFTESEPYEFPHLPGKVRVYPIFQEELISLKRSYPEVQNMRIFTGGNEVELVKNLYQLNLLSNETLPGSGAASVQEFVKKVIPKMKSPQYIEQYMKNGVIRVAQFAAMAEIKVEISQNQKSRILNEVVGLSYHTYNELIGTDYSGATYISYPTGVGGAITIFHTFMKWLEDKAAVRGVIATEQLPELLGERVTSKIKRELSSYNIDLVSHTHVEATDTTTISS